MAMQAVSTSRTANEAGSIVSAAAMVAKAQDGERRAAAANPIMSPAQQAQLQGATQLPSGIQGPDLLPPVSRAAGGAAPASSGALQPMPIHAAGGAVPASSSALQPMPIHAAQVPVPSAVANSNPNPHAIASPGARGSVAWSLPAMSDDVRGVFSYGERPKEHYFTGQVAKKIFQQRSEK